MESIMAILTHEQQAVLGSIRFGSMSTDGTCLTAIVCIHLHGHAVVQQSFVGNHTMQFSKTPLRVRTIGLPLLSGNGFCPLPVLFAPSGPSLRALANVSQVLQSDETVGVLGDDACGDHMIGVLLQPSLSPANDDESSGGGASAFFLKTLPQSR